MTESQIFEEYRRIMVEEFKLIPDAFHHRFILSKSSQDIHKTVLHLREVALSSMVQRSYISHYGLEEKGPEFESVSAHTRLFAELVDQALAATVNDPSQIEPTFGYSYREIMKAIWRHDLPENFIGDIPDNGDENDPRRNDKHTLEQIWHNAYAENSPSWDVDIDQKVNQLLREMEDLSSPAGALLKVADKTAATFMTLTYDSEKKHPLMHIDDPAASKRDRLEMAMCDYEMNGFRRASEMWTIDHFHVRKFTEHDDTGFFTAVIVMYTLVVNGRWYNWRNNDYLHI